MASIRLTQFAGLMPELSAKLKRKDNAQIAHNCLLYDGKLRSMPAYNVYSVLSATPISLYRAKSLLAGAGNVVPEFELRNAVYVDGPPLPTAVFGITTNNDGAYGKYLAVKFGPPGISGNVLPAGIGPLVLASAAIFTVTPMFQTPRPTVVSYAVTALRVNGNDVEESTPIYLGTVGAATTLHYEGDAVAISATFNALTCGETQLRIYRTVTALESGEQLINTFDTDWNLVATVGITASAPVINYTDITPTERIKGDLLLTEGFFSPFFTSAPNNCGLTESGWLWFTSSNEVQFSERYRAHAWSLSGYLKIPNVDSIKSSTVFYDTLYVGTNGVPYKVKVAYDDSDSNNDPMTVNATPYPEVQPSIGGTMVKAPFGALYTSPNGIVALEEDKMQVITRDLLSGGDLLYTVCHNNVTTTFRVQDITNAAWFNGWYIGFGAGLAFVYQPPEDLNAVHPFQQLVTMDLPTNVAPDCWIVGDYGLHTAFGHNLYYWPVPGWVRAGDTLNRLTYKWKSKKFIMPGRTNFGAAKVVWECDGTVCFKLISDCVVVYERVVTDCNPFRLPSEYIGVEFEIILTGTGTVSEVHVASGMKELTEVETE
jgi:hypothetical protein